MIRIKICGITNLQDALLSSEMGADALGFIFTPSARQITPEQARKIILHLPPLISKVGVFRNEEVSTVKEIMNYCFLDMVQLHGDEDKSYVREFARRAIKVFDMTEENVLDKIKKFSLPFFMLDLPKNNKNKFSLDWKIAAEAGNYGTVILAGGLTPENIENILQLTSPYGVDTCRGVEQKKGKKDPRKIKEFILKVRKWNTQNT